MSDSASARYGVGIAPDGLFVAQELVNTIGRRGNPDLLADPRTADDWFAGTSSAWTSARPRTAPKLPLSPRDVVALRSLRGFVYEALKARTHSAEGAGGSIDGDVTLSLDGSAHVLVRPARPRTAAAWFKDVVLVELFTADLTGTLDRLKVCANPYCWVAFYDRTRNGNGAWHDVKACGNKINLRRSRARRAGAQPDVEPVPRICDQAGSASS